MASVERCSPRQANACCELRAYLDKLAARGLLSDRVRSWQGCRAPKTKRVMPELAFSFAEGASQCVAQASQQEFVSAATKQTDPGNRETVRRDGQRSRATVTAPML
jgi:hypothetical protein